MNIAAKTQEPEDDIAAFPRNPRPPKRHRRRAGHERRVDRRQHLDQQLLAGASQKVRWRGADIWIMKEFYPAAALMAPPGKSRAECEELIMCFLSMLSWVEECGFMVEGGGLSGANLPRPMGRDKERGFSICDEFDLSYFPEITNEKARFSNRPFEVKHFQTTHHCSVDVAHLHQ